MGKIFAFKKWTYKVIIGVLIDATKRYDVQIEHFKMMDNHYHLKLTTPSSNIDIIMWFINNQIAKRLNKQNGLKGHFWGGRYHATIIQKDEHAFRCVRYIYNNGVRSGLCLRASEDERFSTFDFYARGKKIKFGVTEDSVYLMMGNTSEERQQEFLLLIDGPMCEEEIRAIRNGLRKLFYGSADFVEQLKVKYLKH